MGRCVLDIRGAIAAVDFPSVEALAERLEGFRALKARLWGAAYVVICQPRNPILLDAGVAFSVRIGRSPYDFAAQPLGWAFVGGCGSNVRLARETFTKALRAAEVAGQQKEAA